MMKKRQYKGLGSSLSTFGEMESPQQILKWHFSQ